jgi:hypothetical protein
MTEEMAANHEPAGKPSGPAYQNAETGLISFFVILGNCCTQQANRFMMSLCIKI